ncbi:DUF3077 domain-containing protein [Pseudomonas alkylphenolica]|uniref:DUF3077 domain-containing protein n=1 Tax=Pseudomonas alkylphenolica TaxID=237609 RepID=A0A6I6GZM0_9PSED|nr:DUF3077 domain-containing protein [Pseudomonas alkylphenolica]QGW77426.1 DUF3077 domain-containing protein [Pseudomonas alkylphenolica]
MTDRKESKDNSGPLKTCGIGSFGEGIGGRIEDRLFRTTAGHDLDYALEQSSVLMSCVHKLTLQAAVDQDYTLVWAAHYLSGMAKALVEDVAHVMAAGALVSEGKLAS